MRILDYKMYVYQGSYTYRAHVRDELGETTGRMMEETATFMDRVVARNHAVADAWIKERHNSKYQRHKDFEVRLIEVMDAPHLLIEYTG